jgi:propionyl-CoA synthetase
MILMAPVTPDAYTTAYACSLDAPGEIWLEAAQAVKWDVVSTRALDDTATPVPRWFPDGVLNTSFNALDRHVCDVRGGQPALVHDFAVTGTSTMFRAPGVPRT